MARSLLPRPVLSLLMLAALLACKKAERRPAPETTTPPDPAAEAKQRRFSLGASDFRLLCDGKRTNVPDAEPRVEDKPRVIAFLKNGDDFAHHEPDQGGLSGIEAVNAHDASVVACVEVVKKTKRKECPMTGLDDPSKFGKLVLYDADFRIRLLDARSGKEIAHATKALKREQCPPIATLGADEELLPNWEASVYLLATKDT